MRSSGLHQSKHISVHSSCDVDDYISVLHKYLHPILYLQEETDVISHFLLKSLK